MKPRPNSRACVLAAVALLVSIGASGCTSDGGSASAVQEPVVPPSTSASASLSSSTSADPVTSEPTSSEPTSSDPASTPASKAGSADVDGATATAPPGRIPKSSPAEAVSTLLKAETTRSHQASFAVLSSVAVEKYPTLEDWSDRWIDLPQITGFSEMSVTGSEVRVLVTHTPGLDPFLGLQFAQEHQVWHTRQEGGGWLVDPDPDVEPVLPPVERAAEAASKWVKANQACDATAVAELHAVRNLLGVSVGAAAVCGSKATYAVGVATEASTSPETSVLVAQFGAGIVQFVRAVEVTGGSEPFVVYLVPIGDDWRVVSVSD